MTVASVAGRLAVLAVCLGVIAVALYGIWVGVLAVLWRAVGS